MQQFCYLSWIKSSGHKIIGGLINHQFGPEGLMKNQALDGNAYLEKRRYAHAQAALTI